MQDKIIVRGAREHNLKNIDVEIPRNKLVVITGLSGSGKSSLAFDTIFAEGQRRYVESLSAYARQFLGQMEKPDVDQIEGLSPAVSIDQKGVSANPRSTVGTVTEIYDYLRLLYARIGIPHCPTCGIELKQQSAQQIVDAVLAMPPDTRIQILAPIIQNKKGNHTKVLEELPQSGFVRARVDGDVRLLEEGIELDRYVIHNIEAVVDRLVLRHFDDPQSEEALGAETRLTDGIETALELGDGVIIINDITDSDNPQDILFSEHLACTNGHGSFPELEPRLFSFNTPTGACPTCQGLGFSLEIDPQLIVTNPDKSIEEGAIDANGWNINDKTGWTWNVFRALAKQYDVPLDRVWRDLSKDQQDIFLYGTGKKKVEVHYTNNVGRMRVYETTFEGVVNNLMRRFAQTESDYIRDKMQSYMAQVPCKTCNGQRLRQEALAVTVADAGIYDVQLMPISDLVQWVLSLRGNGIEGQLNEREKEIARQILNEIEARVGFLDDVGLGYLTLFRSAGSLSGGEAQRIRLASQIGSRLTGVLYVLDEPSIGLHQRDNARLINTLTDLRDIGNTVLVVEHDEETMRSADWLLDLGPGAGEHGGNIVAQGTPKQVMKVKGSLTGDYLAGRFQIPLPETRREGLGQSLIIRGAEENNLRKIDVEIPLGKLVCVTGVSGSGKSSLVVDILYQRLAQVLNGRRERPGKHHTIEGVEAIDKIINIDQSPIGRTPRSNPGTYTKMFDHIRSLFAQMPESKIRGYEQGRFSFNVKGGRCENCGGQGQNKIEMQFLPDIYVDCEVCKGSRYNRETLQVHYKGKNIADVLNMTVSEGMDFFQNHPPILNKLETLHAVGLSYIRIGQSATTLSGGEAQRIKLSRELSKRATGKTLFILDEPSTGLHAVDVLKLINVIQQLVDQGNTVVVIEHNLDIIKTADWLIDLGPEGGDRGGMVIAEGTPEQVAMLEHSYTGQYLRPYVKIAELAAD
ncbi:MAG: excinuclease ABC subunit UvrA [Anaerolineae bacterium]|nr:excinuclease ABC subunit UvrA [Anaerolineae bacterium]